MMLEMNIVRVRESQQTYTSILMTVDNTKRVGILKYILKRIETHGRSKVGYVLKNEGKCLVLLIN